MRYHKWIVLASVLIVWQAGAGHMEAAQPSADLECGIRALQAAIINSTSADMAHDANIRRVISEWVDFNELSKLTLGKRRWLASAAHQERFTELFRDFLMGLFFDHAGTFKTMQVKYGEEVAGYSRSSVETEVITDRKAYRGSSVVFRMHLIDGRWKIYNVIIGGIYSIASNYGSQFNSILKRSSFEDLLRMLEKKQLVG